MHRRPEWLQQCPQVKGIYLNVILATHIPEAPVQLFGIRYVILPIP